MACSLEESKTCILQQLEAVPDMSIVGRFLVGSDFDALTRQKLEGLSNDFLLLGACLANHAKLLSHKAMKEG